MIHFLLGASLHLILLHPVHSTFAEAEWNPESNRLEVALQLDVLDEQLIDRILKKQTLSDDVILFPKQTDRIVAKRIQYLAMHFRVETTTDKKSIDDQSLKKVVRYRYHWIGRQEKGAHAWWYFEIELPGQKKPIHLHQSILLDQDARYQHRVLLINTQPSVTLTFNQDVTVRRLDGNHE